ncbi:hypothetical protein F5B20DRAFT_595791 [Whalleya microplaca]|nr:hypothetical protein F5B20DRAFT_595791 [Whalleya microplaca]
MALSLSPVGGNASVYGLDHRQMNEIIMPELHDMANNPDLLERVRDRRFDRDDPPPYRSPSSDNNNEDVDDDDDSHDNNDDNAPISFFGSIVGPIRKQIMAEIDELVNAPFTEQELRDTQRHLEAWHPAYHPGRQYESEAAWEARHMLGDPALRDFATYKSLDGRAGEQRQQVYIRHRIKQRWETLGVWNPEWGIPGRVNEEIRDKTSSWKWRWQAVHLREGLRRGERVPPLPRHNLTADASKSVAVSFITSRPSYIYSLEAEEERTRLDRLPYQKARFYNVTHVSHEQYVSKRWREGGDRDPYEKGRGFRRPGWKWKHESPSPEPVGLSNMEFTPSEIDALEAIPPPTPPPPRRSLNPCSRPHPIFGKKPEANEVSSPKLRALVPEAEVIEREDEAIPRYALRPPETPGPRRSIRIAERTRHLMDAAAQTDLVRKTTRPQKGVPRESRNSRVVTKVEAGSVSPAPKRGRGRPPKTIQSKSSRPQGIAKKRGRPRTRT